MIASGTACHTVQPCLILSHSLHTVTGTVLVLSYCPTVLLSAHCLSVSLSYCLSVPLSCCHTVLVSHCPTVLLSHCISVPGTVPLSCCHTVLVSHCPTVLLSLCPTIIPGCHTVLVSHSRSYCYTVVLVSLLCTTYTCTY